MLDKDKIVKITLILALALIFPETISTNTATLNQPDQAAFRQELLSHHMVITAEWKTAENPPKTNRSHGTLSIIAKTEDENGSTFYGITNFHVGSPDFKSLPANVEFFVGILIVDEKVIARRFAFRARVVSIDPSWDRMLFQLRIPRNPKELGEDFLRWLSQNELPTNYDYDMLVRNILPARFANLTIAPQRGTQLWLAGFAGGGAPRIVELAMNFEDLPGKYQFNFAVFKLPRIWLMDVISAPVGGMSGGFVYNLSGEAVALYHGHFAVEKVAVLAATTPGPDVKAWALTELSKLGVRLP